MDYGTGQSTPEAQEQKVSEGPTRQRPAIGCVNHQPTLAQASCSRVESACVGSINNVNPLDEVPMESSGCARLFLAH